MAKLPILNIGDTASAWFRTKNHRRHKISGTVTEIEDNHHDLPGTWVTIRVTGGDLSDPFVQAYSRYQINVAVPISDIIR